MIGRFVTGGHEVCKNTTYPARTQEPIYLMNVSEEGGDEMLKYADGKLMAGNI